MHGPVLTIEHRRAHDCSDHDLPEVSARVCLEDPLWEPTKVSPFFFLSPFLLLKFNRPSHWGFYLACYSVVLLERRASDRLCVVAFEGFLSATLQRKKNPHPAPCVVYPVLSLGVSKTIFCFGEAVLWFPCSLSCVSFSRRAGGLSYGALVTMFVHVCMQDQHQ